LSGLTQIVLLTWAALLIATFPNSWQLENGRLTARQRLHYSLIDALSNMHLVRKVRLTEVRGEVVEDLVG
jgi:hypothetical protein